ncbi:MAG: hypothetical protein ACLPOQ_04280 [Desulfobaccales bacterium]|jgi:hypothetical protein
METGRGRSSKKPWHLTLRLTEVIFAVFGMLGLLMTSFTLGVLAGRGDIYRVAYSLGLLVQEPQQAAQGIPPLGLMPAPTQSAAALAPAVAPGPAAAVPAPAAAPAARAAAASRPSPPAPVTGSMVPLPPPAAAVSARKRAARAAHAQEQKAREEQLRQHQDLAKKLTFLNSFDNNPKPALPQIKVATYRDGKTARAKVAALEKQGIKATLREGKDDQGAYYTVFRPAPNPKKSEKLAQDKDAAKPVSPASSHKPQN